MLCFLRGMAFIPFLLVTWSSAAFIISYVVAVLSGHVNPFLPYIRCPSTAVPTKSYYLCLPNPTTSAFAQYDYLLLETKRKTEKNTLSDTGTTPPESGIFGFMINFSAFLGAATMYTRYKIVEKQNQTSYFSTPVFNLVSLVLGLVGCIGMGIVANFQELAVPVVHDGGALLAFVCGVVYTLLQSIISYKSCPQWNSLSTCRIRMAISAVSSAAVIPMIACASLISITKLEWNPKEKDYVYHVVSAICEWTVAFGFIFYFLTFIYDFQSVTLRISTEINEKIRCSRKWRPLYFLYRFCFVSLCIYGNTLKEEFIKNAYGWMFAHFTKCEAGPLLSKTCTWRHFSPKSRMTNEKQVIPEEEVGLEI
eukprot:bmy_08311T0